MMNAKMMINEEFNGIEIYFNNKPNEEIRNELKANGYRWHSQKKCWYAKNTPARLNIAMNYTVTNIEEMAAIAKAEPKTEKQKTNDYGVQVGDIFSASWGWEQTNNDFFQVVELVGKKSARVRSVNPELLSTSAVSGMSEDRTFKLTKEILPPASFSVFIKDQERGDLKRLDKWGDKVCFKLSSFAHAYKEDSDTTTVYESWYA